MDKQRHISWKCARCKHCPCFVWIENNNFSSSTFAFIGSFGRLVGRWFMPKFVRPLTTICHVMIIFDSAMKNVSRKFARNKTATTLSDVVFVGVVTISASFIASSRVRTKTITQKLLFVRRFNAYKLRWRDSTDESERSREIVSTYIFPTARLSCCFCAFAAVFSMSLLLFLFSCLSCAAVIAYPVHGKRH